MQWQDFAIALAQAVLILSLVPAIRRHSTLPLATTLMSACASCVILVSLSTLGLWLAAAMSGVKLLLWCVLAVQSYRAETTH
jgi:hypothetical protein